MREIFKFLQYLCQHLTNFDEVSRGKAYLRSQANRLKILNPSWQMAANSKIEKNFSFFSILYSK